MKISLPVLTIIFLVGYCNTGLANEIKNFRLPGGSSIDHDSLQKKNNDSAPQMLKICACQVLQLQSLNHKPRNFALYAERTNRKSYSYDLHKAKWILEKEKKHLADFFYDKLEVVDDIVEVSDCKSLFVRMKKKHKSLILYDILDADLKK